MMKKILTIFLGLLFAQGANAQSAAPSGVYSLTGQETVKNDSVHYPTVHEFIVWQVTGDISEEIKKFNGTYLANGEHMFHKKDFFLAHKEELHLTASASFNSQLKMWNDEQGGMLFPGDDNPTVEKYPQLVESRMRLVYIKFNLAPGEKIFLLGEKGDFSGGAYVQHLSADGWYYVFDAAPGVTYLGPRASCGNTTTDKMTHWIMQGKAVIISNDNGLVEKGSDDPKPGGTYIDGKMISAGNGTTIINLYGGSNTAYGGAGGEGGSAISNSTSKVGNTTAKLIGTPNPSYNPNQVTTVTTPATTVVPVQTQAYPPQMQMYPPIAQYPPQYPPQYPNTGWGNQWGNQWGNNRPNYSFSLDLGSWNIGSGGRNGGCFGGGGYNPNPNPNPVNNGGFVYNPAILGNTNGDGGGTGGGFVYNGARPGH